MVGFAEEVKATETKEMLVKEKSNAPPQEERCSSQ